MTSRRWSTAKLLKPLGNPHANSIKFFATADILEQMKDRTWLVRVSSAPFTSIGRKERPPAAPGGAATSPTIILSGRRKGARQRSGQRERVTDSKGLRPLARGLGTAAVPKPTRKGG